MKKIYALVFCLLAGCATGGPNSSGGGMGSTVNTMNLLTQFLNAYPQISTALALNRKCNILPEEKANRFEGYVSSINVFMTQTGFIPQSTLNSYQKSWMQTAAEQAELSCSADATERVIGAMGLASTIYQQLGLGA
ncbi:hypothetical protein WKI13_02955 [Teredinibacter turnerae]|uniref:hypothetical protein n=1 Tax=Teredinibacter turnerae TaxID=2426 RepID=UPI00037D8C0B|nr:hypothetical protein [Teredinibacter turnerae]